MGRAGKQRRRERQAEERRLEWERKQFANSGKIELRQPTGQAAWQHTGTSEPAAETQSWQEQLSTVDAACPRCGKGFDAVVSRAEKRIAVTADELAGLLSVSRSTVDRMSKAGSLPGRFEIQGSVRFHVETVEAWAKAKASVERAKIAEMDY